MRHRSIRIISLVLIVLATTACGSGSGTASPSAARATTFAEYGTAFCDAFDALFVAIGNPDTADYSTLHKSLDAAVAAGDTATAESVARTMTARLESGRQRVAFAAGWPPAAPMMAQLDRVFVAFEAMIAAKRASVGAPDAAAAQAAFEKAGGVEAWFAMLQEARKIQRPADAGDGRCPTVPVSY